MRRRMLALLAAGTFALVGCGDSEPTGSTDRAAEPPAPATSTPVDTATTPAATGDPCGGVSAGQIAEWSGARQTLLEPDAAGPITRCGTGYDEAGMIVTWSFTPLVGSLAVEAGNAELPGLRRSRLELADGVPAWQLSGEVAGTRTARVVTVLGERTLSVDANDGGDTTATVTDAVLAEVARNIAEQVVAADVR